MLKKIFLVFIGCALWGGAAWASCTASSKTYTSCKTGYYLSGGSCNACTGVSYTDTENISGGTRSRTCTGTGAGGGGTGGSSSCTVSCGSWSYSCSSGYYLSGSSCSSCSGVSFTDTQSITGGTKSRTCYRTGGAGGTSGSGSCTGSANCGSWTYNCTTSGYTLNDAGTGCVIAEITCSSGYYLSGGSCYACTGVSFVDEESISCGSSTRSRTCYRTGGAGGTSGASACTGSSNCGSWTYNCDSSSNCALNSAGTGCETQTVTCSSGYYLSGGSCHACSDATFTDSESISNGTRSRTCYYTGGAGGQLPKSSCTGSTNCGSWTYTCNSGCTLSGTTCSCSSGGGGTCYTVTCSTAMECIAAGYTKCSNGCCTGTMSHTCNTVTCGSNSTCTAAGYSACTNGCCTGTAVSTNGCTTTTCSSSDDCSRVTVDTGGGMGVPADMCQAGYCYSSTAGGSYSSRAKCLTGCTATGFSCQQVSTLLGTVWRCMPSCTAGNFFNGNGSDNCNCQACSSYVTEAWSDSALTTTATATVAAGTEPITSCYIPAGGYYDERGAFSYASNCYYTE